MTILIEQYRVKKGFSQRTLAMKSGVARSHIASMEAGETNPTIEVICKLAKVLDVEPQDLFTC